MYNTMHKKFYTIQNLFDLKSDIITTNVITRCHNLKVFVQPLNCNQGADIYRSAPCCNTVKYSFFHCITNVWNALPNSVVNATNVKLFNENLVDIHLFKYLRCRAII